MLLLKDRSSQEPELISQSPVPDLMSEYVQAPDSLLQSEEKPCRLPDGPRPALKEETIETIPTLPTPSVPATMQACRPDVQVSVRCFCTHTPMGMETCKGRCDDCSEASSSRPPKQKADPFLTPTRKKLERPSVETSGQDSLGNEVSISQSESPIVDRTNSPSSELNDDADDIFDTPIRNTHGIQAQCSPLTPPSTYSTTSTWLGDNKSSPSKTRSTRPGPQPLQDVEGGTETGFRGRKTLHQLGKDQSKSPKLSVEFCIPTARSRSRISTPKKVEEDSSQTSIKTKVEEGILNDHGTYTEDSSGPINLQAQPCASSPRVKHADILIRIFGFDILDRIQQDPVRQDLMQCVAQRVASKVSSDRCKTSWKHNVSAAQEYLHKLQQWLSLQSCIEALKSLIELLFCGRNHRSIAKERAVNWLLKHQGVAIIQEIVKDVHGSDTIMMTDHEITKLFNMKTPDVIPKGAKEDVVSPSPKNFHFPAERSIQPPQCYRVRGRPRGRKLWQPPGIADLCVSHSLIKEIIQPLTPKEVKSGYLYIYTTTGDFGMRKIGVTENEDISKRLRSSAAKCKIDAIPLSTQMYQPVLAKHVYRLEKLVHTELKEMRYQITHCRCGGVKSVKHREWFDVKDKHAIEVIRRWTAWLETDPYENCNGIWLPKGLYDNFGLGHLSTPYVLLEEEIVRSRASRGKTPVQILGERRSSKRIAARAMPTQIQ